MNVSFDIIGQNIKKARRAAGLTQKQAAARSELSALHYKRIERGEQPVSMNQLARIGTALLTPFESLLSGCILDAGNHAAVLKTASDQPAGYAEYALILTHQYLEPFTAPVRALRCAGVLH